jgi:signal peptidase I
LIPDFLCQVQQDRLREFIDSLARTPLSQVVLFAVFLTIVRIALYPYLKRTAFERRRTAYSLARFVNESLDAFIYAGVFVFMLVRPFLVQAFLIPSGSMWPTLAVNDFIIANKAIYRYSDPKFQDIVVFRPPPRAILDPSQLTPNGEVKVDFIKRCIGLPGDLIELRQGDLVRNGQRVSEPYRTYSECTLMAGQDCQDFRPLSAQEMSHLSKASFKLVRYKDRIIPLNYTDRDANSRSPITTFADNTVAPYYVAKDYQLDDPEVMEDLMHAPPVRIPPGFYLMMGDNRNGSFDSRGWGLVPRSAIIGRSELVWLPINRWHETR